MLTPSKGRRNQSRGKNFEVQCAERVKKLGLDLMVKRVQRPNIYVPYYDLEFPTLGIGIDCKFTFNSFTHSEKESLYKEVKLKYGNRVVVVIGERRAQARLSFENNVKVLIQTRYGLGEVRYDDWLLSIVNIRGERNA